MERSLSYIKLTEKPQRIENCNNLINWEWIGVAEKQPEDPTSSGQNSYQQYIFNVKYCLLIVEK